MAKPAVYIDESDDQPGHGIAAYELAGAIHGSVEFGLLGQLPAAAQRLLVIDQPLVQIGIDAHLLAGHGIEGESRGDFGDTAGALGDHHEIDDHQDAEDDQSDHVVSADDKIAERLDDPAAKRVQQNLARRRHVQGEPEQRHQQQDRREGREFKGILELNDEHDDEDAQAHHEREQDVQQGRWNRHEQGAQDQDDRRRHEQVGLPDFWNSRRQLYLRDHRLALHNLSNPPLAQPVQVGQDLGNGPIQP